LDLKTNLHFIVNPIAGSGKNRLSATLLESFFPEKTYSITIKKTEFVAHAITLTKQSIKEGAEIVVACGGDGTINEVASCLIGTDVLLGIVPMGSGNGLASNLKIPKNLKKALKIIKNQQQMAMDVGTINGEPFFSNTGVGFDAHVISDFAESPTRQLFSYISSTIKTLRSYSYNNMVEVKYDSEKEVLSPFLLFISNSNEMGYKMSLTPRASLRDGLLDVVIVPQLSHLKLFVFTLLFLFKKHHWLKEVRFLEVTDIAIKSVDGVILKAQKDGELFILERSEIDVKVLPERLNVCVFNTD
jgi:YegS/Rv2252/BmrU family lipid kinase